MRVAPILAALLVLGGTTAARANSGRARELTVTPPRVEAEIAIDGVLDEPVWQQAVRLTDFSGYAPVDGRAAEDPTEVLVWYSPHAIHFGVRAGAVPGSVRATLANRDRIDQDDSIQIFLSTFNDGRQAVVFGVNPLGVQADGAITEGTRQLSNGFSGLKGGREATDLSPDYVFDSKGRLTDVGYDVEIRIPFKTLRYQATDVQDWGIHVLRIVQSRGHEDSWAPALQSGTSFLGQGGTLKGLRDLRRGLVLDLNPVVTARADGAPGATGWRYVAHAPDLGANVRWGVTSNLTLNGAVKPDFSQVETDAGQLQFDPRQALYFAEKRPFFLDGIEQFETPNRLIYTRRIVAPLVASKLAGKIGATTVATLFAVDDPSTLRRGAGHPLIGIARVQRDVGSGSRAALVYTDRADGSYSNRVVAPDVRFTFGKLYTLQAQAAVSRTANGAIVRTAPLWDATLSRNGRSFSFRYSLSGIDPGFVASNGLIQRGGVAHGLFDNGFTLYGKHQALVQRFSTDVSLDANWDYETFRHRGPALERRFHINHNATLRGGWEVGWSWLIERYDFDPKLYADYYLRRDGPAGPEYLPFTGTPHLPNLDYVLTVATPALSHVAGNVMVLWGVDENFFEWSRADIVIVQGGADWRPTDRLRVSPAYQLQQYRRHTDGTLVGRRQIPGLKVEYQLSRAVFVRMIGECDGRRQDALRDDSRTNLPIVIRDAVTGAFVPQVAFERNRFRLDWLFSYQPTPGTVFFAGYSSALEQPPARSSRRLQRLNDGFFVKISYLFRM